MTIELCLTALVCAVAYGWPRLGASCFSRIEKTLSILARRKSLAVAVVGFSEILLRLAILPFCPIPLPFLPDDFSYLLGADTFAHGRLTNPTPLLWTHFESLHITMQPTYMSMYFPAQALVLAAGKVLFGHPWYASLLVSALMCASICWMLQAWLPPTWALLGGLLAVLRIGLFTYWINTYTASGAIAALGGALVLGAMPRLMKQVRTRHGLLMAVGMVLLATTRPYEGLLLCVLVTAALGRWIFFGRNRPSGALVLRRAVPALVLMAAAGAWMAHYDAVAFGNPMTLPYSVDRATYAVAPYYVWQQRRPAPVYRHEELRRFYCDLEPHKMARIQTLPGLALDTLVKAASAFLFFAGIALLPPLIMLRRVFLDRRIRFLVLCAFVLAAGMAIEIYLIPHYLAPFTAVFYAIGLQAMRHLRCWKPEGRPVGLGLLRFILTLCLALGGLRLFAAPLQLISPYWPGGEWAYAWYGPLHFGTERAQIETRLEQLPGNQLVLVRYSANHFPLEEWVYNAADIDASKVIWAREMDAANNLELIRHYRGRKVWLVEPDAVANKITPYPVPSSVPATP
jgi:hypothetical protein